MGDTITCPFYVINNMKIKQSWTYNHKLLLVTISLAIAHIVPLVPLPTIEANTVTYTAPEAYSMASHVEARAHELYAENRPYDLERYRQDALVELSHEIEPLLYTSPFIDYEALHNKYGF